MPGLAADGDVVSLAVVGVIHIALAVDTFWHLAISAQWVFRPVGPRHLNSFVLEPLQCPLVDWSGKGFVLLIERHQKNFLLAGIQRLPAYTPVTNQ